VTQPAGHGAIRLMRRADFDEVMRIRYAVRENRLVSMKIGPELYAEHIERKGRGWVAEEAGRIVGFAIGDRDEADIWALFVDPPFEGRGHGRRLHDTMVDWMFAQGLPRITLGTDPHTRAERFYIAAGWRFTHLRDDGEHAYELLAPHSRG